MDIKIKRIENGQLPEYKTDGSAGADCFARIDIKQIVRPKKVVTIPLGFAVELPLGYEMQIRGRSGIARKNNVEVFNSPGTIDSDYRGEVSAILYNASEDEFIVNPNDRIAQAVICPVIKANWNEVAALNETERGAAGFGSTGVAAAEKFYEPFTKEHELEELLGKKVTLLPNETKAIFTRFYHAGMAIMCHFKIVEINKESQILNSVEYDTITAFQRVKIDGHRFGKEIEFEG